MTGHPLHAEREGHGPAVVLLHGFTGSSRSWDDLRPELRSTFSVVAVDLPGHGRSPAPVDPARYAMPAVIAELARTLDHLGIANAAVLGYSMGGRTALRFAIAHPDRCSALVLESTSSGIPDPGRRAARRASDEALAILLDDQGIEAFVNQWEHLPLWASQAYMPDERRDRLRALRLGQSAAGLANSLRGGGAGEETPVLDVLPGLRIPVLLIAGALDEPYVAHAAAMAERLPDARVEIVPGAGHAVHVEQPIRYASLVRSFLMAHSLPRSPQENA